MCSQGGGAGVAARMTMAMSAIVGISAPFVLIFRIGLHYTGWARAVLCVSLSIEDTMNRLAARARAKVFWHATRFTSRPVHHKHVIGTACSAGQPPTLLTYKLESVGNLLGITGTVELQTTLYGWILHSCWHLIHASQLEMIWAHWLIGSTHISAAYHTHAQGEIYWLFGLWWPCIKAICIAVTFYCDLWRQSTANRFDFMDSRARNPNQKRNDKQIIWWGDRRKKTERNESSKHNKRLPRW